MFSKVSSIGAVAALLAIAGAAPGGAFTLDPRYTDADGDLVADIPEDPDAWVDPSTLIFAYTPVEPGVADAHESGTFAGEGWEGEETGRMENRG